MDIANTASNTDGASCGQVGGLICGGWGDVSTVHSDSGVAIANARENLIVPSHQVNWQTQEREMVTNPGQSNEVRTPAGFQSPSAAEWTELATAAAKRACRAEGYPQVTKVAFGPGHNGNNGSASGFVGNGLGLLLSENRETNNPNEYQYQMRQSRTWTATCKKTIRRTRR